MRLGRGRGAKQEWDYFISTTQKRGYKPALRIDGPQAGQLVWAKRRSHGSGTKPAKKTLQEKREELQIRRVAAAIESIQAEVAAPKKVPRLYTLIGLAIVVGTLDNFTYAPSWREKGEELSVDRVREFAKAGNQTKARGALWREQLWPALVERTTIDSWCREAGYAVARLEELREWVGPLGVDVDEHLAAATEANPEPEAWTKPAKKKAAKKKAAAA